MFDHLDDWVRLERTKHSAMETLGPFLELTEPSDTRSASAQIARVLGDTRSASAQIARVLGDTRSVGARMARVLGYQDPDWERAQRAAKDYIRAVVACNLGNLVRGDRHSLNLDIAGFVRSVVAECRFSAKSPVVDHVAAAELEGLIDECRAQLLKDCAGRWSESEPVLEDSPGPNPDAPLPETQGDRVNEVRVEQDDQPAQRSSVGSETNRRLCHWRNPEELAWGTAEPSFVSPVDQHAFELATAKDEFQQHLSAAVRANPALKFGSPLPWRTVMEDLGIQLKPIDPIQEARRLADSHPEVGMLSCWLENLSDHALRAYGDLLIADDAPETDRLARFDKYAETFLRDSFDKRWSHGLNELRLDRLGISPQEYWGPQEKLRNRVRHEFEGILARRELESIFERQKAADANSSVMTSLDPDQGRPSEADSPEGDRVVPLPEPQSDRVKGPVAERRALVDTFLNQFQDQTGRKGTRKMIWQLARHQKARQFERWQSSDINATGADERNFARILSLSPSDFESELKKRGIIPESLG